MLSSIPSNSKEIPWAKDLPLDPLDNRFLQCFASEGDQWGKPKRIAQLQAAKDLARILPIRGGRKLTVPNCNMLPANAADVHYQGFTEIIAYEKELPIFSICNSRLEMASVGLQRAHAGMLRRSNFKKPVKGSPLHLSLTHGDVFTYKGNPINLFDVDLKLVVPQSPELVPEIPQDWQDLISLIKRSAAPTFAVRLWFHGHQGLSKIRDCIGLFLEREGGAFSGSILPNTKRAAAPLVIKYDSRYAGAPCYYFQQVWKRVKVKREAN